MGGASRFAEKRLVLPPVPEGQPPRPQRKMGVVLLGADLALYLFPQARRAPFVFAVRVSPR